MAEPPDQMPAAAGIGYLRASHADREQVIGTLKENFVGAAGLEPATLACKAGHPGGCMSLDVA